MKIRNLVILFVILLTTLVIFIGCGDADDTATGDEGTESVNGDLSGADDESPGLESLSYYVAMNPNPAPLMTDYNGIAVYQELERMTGVTVDFEHPPSGDDGSQAFNLMMASGEYPDVIEAVWPSLPGGPDEYLSGGQIIPLNDYLEEHAPNFYAILQENPEWEKQIMTDDGTIYGFPFFRGGDDNPASHFYGPVIRKDWLDNLGLEIPETIDEWDTVLRAFKNDDPTGTGSEVIPFLPTVSSNMFISAWGITNGFYQVDNEVRYGPIQPEFKEYLTVMNEWYEEGLIDQEYVTTDADLTDNKVTQHQLGGLVVYNGGGLGKYLGLMQDDPDFQLIGTPYPVLNKGDTPIVGQRAPNYEGVAAAISSTNEHIEETIKWLDYGYSEEGFMLFNWGIEGESYEINDGEPVYTEQITNNPDGLPLAQALSEYTRVTWSGPFVQDPNYSLQYNQYEEQTITMETWANTKNDILMPITAPTPEESSELAAIMTDLQTHKDSMLDLFITGQESLDNFDEYVATLESMNIERAIEIQQDALDRFLAR